MMIMECEKAWEVVVGQTIGRLEWSDPVDFNAEGGLASFLGRKLVNGVLTAKKPAAEIVTPEGDRDEPKQAAAAPHG